MTSRQSPDSTPATVPSALTRHCWLVPPLQVQISTRVPAEVAWPGTSRHLLPYTRSSLPDVWVHCWLAPPLQSQMSSSVPSLWLAFGTSRHRLEPTPRSTPPDPPVPPPRAGRDGQVVELRRDALAGAVADLAGAVGGVGDGTDGGAVDGRRDAAAAEFQRQGVPATRTQRRRGTAGQGTDATAGAVTEDGPRSGVGDPEVVGVQVARVLVGIGARAPDELNVAGLLQHHIRRRPCSCSSRGRPAARTVEPAAWSSRSAPAPTSGGRTARTGRAAADDLEGPLDVHEVLRFAGGAVAVEGVAVRQRERSLPGTGRRALALPGRGGDRVDVSGLARLSE